MAAPDETTADRTASAKEIVKLFNIERYCYLGLSLVTASLVIYVGYQTLFYPVQDKSATAFALFGSTGVVSYNIGRLLNMFNKVIDAVFLK